MQKADGMPVDCAINGDNLHTIPKSRSRERILALRPEQGHARTLVQLVEEVPLHIFLTLLTQAGVCT